MNWLDKLKKIVQTDKKKKGKYQNIHLKRQALVKCVRKWNF